MYFRESENLQEKNPLDEMSLRIISSRGDDLPFKVVIKCPDKGRYDHAHIIRIGTKCEELGAFVITKYPPRSVDDLVGYCEGRHSGLRNIPRWQLEMLVDWAARRNEFLPAYNNWQVLQYEYRVNRKDF